MTVIELKSLGVGTIGAVVAVGTGVSAGAGGTGFGCYKAGTFYSSIRTYCSWLERVVTCCCRFFSVRLGWPGWPCIGPLVFIESETPGGGIPGLIYSPIGGSI